MLQSSLPREWVRANEKMKRSAVAQQLFAAANFSFFLSMKSGPTNSVAGLLTVSFEKASVVWELRWPLYSCSMKKIHPSKEHGRG